MCVQTVTSCPFQELSTCRKPWTSSTSEASMTPSSRSPFLRTPELSTRFLALQTQIMWLSRDPSEIWSKHEAVLAPVISTILCMQSVAWTYSRGFSRGVNDMTSWKTPGRRYLTLMSLAKTVRCALWRLIPCMSLEDRPLMITWLRLLNNISFQQISG